MRLTGRVGLLVTVEASSSPEGQAKFQETEMSKWERKDPHSDPPSPEYQWLGSYGDWDLWGKSDSLAITHPSREGKDASPMMIDLLTAATTRGRQMGLVPYVDCDVFVDPDKD